MSREARWHRVEELYHAALEREPADRAAFLQASCDDEAVRREVASLLADGTVEEFLATPALELAGRNLSDDHRSMIGRRIGHYEVRSLLGAGGMGEVYRARDTKLQREVAIKVLPRRVADDPARVARFAREARLLAALNHPNIAAVHGLEDGEGISAIILELVEGETLRERIERGPIPTADAIAIAQQIATGLEAAHETGIVHRDLKPSNIKLRPDGAVKILDFGLAKALDTEPAGAGAAAVPARSATHVGVIMGSTPYMSPEQAQGRPVDTRTDIWAFGCVLYEMLTGKPPFTGRDAAETLTAVLATEPPWDALPRDLTPALLVFLRRCLSKDVKQRVSDVRMMRLALDGAFETDTLAARSTAGVHPTRRRMLTTAGLAAGAALLSGPAVWVWLRSTPSVPLVSRFSIELPTGQTFNADNIAHVIAISANGTHIAVAVNGGLWLRSLQSLEPTLLPRTTGAHTPFFSPDGQWLAFYSGNRLMRIAVKGGLPEPIATIDRPFGATWGEDDRILFGRGTDGIWQVSAAGGMPQQIIAVAEGDRAHSPQALPDGSVLFTFLPKEAISWDDAQIVVQPRQSKERILVVRRGRDARFLPTGHVVYASSSELLGAPFDLAAHRITRGQVSLVQGVWGPFLGFTDASHFAVANTGTLVYVPSPPSGDRRTVVWVSQDGSEGPPLELPPVPVITSVRIAPDGRRIIAAENTTGGGIFVSDTTRLSWTRIAGGAFPMWMPDSKTVVFGSNHEGVRGLFRTRVDGPAGNLELLAEVEDSLLTSPGGSTGDGRQIVFTFGNNAQPRLGLLDLDRVGKDERPWRPLFKVDKDGSAASLSPNSRWLAYQSAHEGKFHVYVEPFRELDRQPTRISSPEGGSGPVWSSDGGKLYYTRVDDGAMMAVPVETAGSELKPKDPVVLFENKGWPAGPLPGRGGGRSHDVASDGRFLMVKFNAVSSTSIVVVQHWFDELKRLAPVD